MNTFKKIDFTEEKQELIDSLSESVKEEETESRVTLINLRLSTGQLPELHP